MKDQSVANVHSTSWVERVQFISLSQKGVENAKDWK